MSLVKYAPTFRVTFYVFAVLILVLGGAAVVSSPKDVLPDVDSPVITMTCTYAGLSAKEMESRVTTYSEFALSNNVNGVRSLMPVGINPPSSCATTSSPCR